MGNEELRRDIFGYEGQYLVTSFSRILSLKYGKERELKPCKDKYGYLHVVLCKDGKGKCYYVHRLIAEAFIPNPEKKPQVNHINGDKTDNRIENLEWVTSSENRQHAYDTGLQLKGENHGSAKHPDLVIHKIFEMAKQGKTQTVIAKEVGYSQIQISRILRGKQRSYLTQKVNQIND